MEKKRSASAGRMLGVGWGAGMVMLFAGTLFLTYLVSENKLEGNMQPYGITAVILMSSITGSAMAIRGKKHISTAAIFSGVFWLGLLAITILFFDGVFHGMVVTLLLITGGSMLPLLFGLKSKNRYGRMESFNHYR